MKEKMKSIEEKYLLLGRKIPNSEELEKIVLGSILLDGEVMNEYGGIIHSSLFYKKEHVIIFDAIKSMYFNDKQIDIVTLYQELRIRNQADLVGGAIAVSNLTKNVCSASNIATHIRILQQFQIKRDVIRSCSKAIDKAFDDSEDPLDMIEELSKAFDNKLDDFCERKFINAYDLASETVNNLSSEKGNAAQGLYSGFLGLDRGMGCFVNNGLYILAARPGQGKTGLMLNIADFMEKQGNSVAIFSLEMDNEQLMQRHIAQMTGIPSSRMKQGNLDTHQLQTLKSAVEKYKNSKMFFDDTPGLTISQLKAKARRMKQLHDIKVIFIDYLQLIDTAKSEEKMTTNDRVAIYSKGLKKLARELKIPIIALSQLNRGVEHRSDKKPLLSDLRDSGAIEQDADGIIFLYRPDYYNDDPSTMINTAIGEISQQGIAVIDVAKNRHGKVFETHLKFNGELIQFNNLNNNFDIYQKEEYKNTNITIEPNTSFDSKINNKGLPF